MQRPYKDQLPRLAESLSKLLPQIGVVFASLGPALPEVPESYAAIPDAISASENIFFGGVMADKSRGVDMSALRACAEIIARCASLHPNGFANLRFAALANVPAGAPFFPAAYHEGDAPSFAIATESADLAVQAFENAKSLEDGRNALISEITKHGQALAKIANSLISNSPAFGLDTPQETRARLLDHRQSPVSSLSSTITNYHLPIFGGIDFSLAPSPDDAHSLGNAVEKMGVPKIGLHGSLAAAAILTEAVDRADFPHSGFSGFMQPVLEDSVLARRAAEGTLTIKDLLLYSTVCGTGLDTVPLPGDTSAEQIAALLLDLSVLALRLDKPLTARLMPVPGKKAGDATQFDFGFFVNSKVMALDAEPLLFPLKSEESFRIKNR